MTNLTVFGKSICTGIGVAGGAIATALGGADAILVLLFYLAIFDYISGVIVAVKRKKLSSETGAMGIVKKMMIFGLVFVGHRLDVALGTTFMRNMVLFFFVSNEGISLLENTSALGVPYPEKLKEILLQLKEQPQAKEAKR